MLPFRTLIPPVVLCAVAGVAAGQTIDDGLAELRERPAYRVLASAWVFKSSAVGYSGRTPPEVDALRILVEDPRGAAALRELLVRARWTPGRLYALCGLFYVDPDTFRTEVDRWRGSREVVETLTGCCGGRARVGDLIESDGPNPVRLRGSEQRLEDWLARARGSASDGKFRWSEDILGGGTPARLCRRTGREATPILSADEAADLLEAGGPARREDALRALELHRADAVPALRRLLGEDDPAPRLAALRLCESLGPVARALQPTLIACLETRGEVAAAAAWALRSQGPWAQPAIPALHRALARQGRSPAETTALVHALQRLLWTYGRLAPAELPDFVQAREVSRGDRGRPRDSEAPPGPEQAVEHRIGRLPGAAVRALIRGLGSDDEDLRRSCRSSLECAGPGALPDLEAALADPRPAVRREVARAIAALAERCEATRERARRALAKRASDADPEVAELAAELADELGRIRED